MAVQLAFKTCTWQDLSQDYNKKCRIIVSYNDVVESDSFHIKSRKVQSKWAVSKSGCDWFQIFQGKFVKNLPFHSTMFYVLVLDDIKLIVPLQVCSLTIIVTIINSPWLNLLNLNDLPCYFLSIKKRDVSPCLSIYIVHVYNNKCLPSVADRLSAGKDDCI